MFYSLNSFTKLVDFLLDKVLEMPMIAEAKYTKCLELVVEQLKQPQQSIDSLRSDEFIAQLMEESGITDRRGADLFLLRSCIESLQTPRTNAPVNGSQSTWL